MKLQPASKKEITRVGIGSLLCLGLMLTAFFVLSLVGVGVFDYTVILGGVCGTAVAVLNFAALCLTIQVAADTESKKQMRAKVQLSYHFRLIAQAGWILVAFLTPCFHVIAAALPLLFPSAVIFFLQSRGRLVTPSDRKNPPREQDNEAEQLDSFEV